MSIYTAATPQALRDEVVKLCGKAVLAYVNGDVGLSSFFDRCLAISNAVAPPVPTPEPVLRELKFSDGYVYRWNGRLEFASKLRDEWVVADQVPMADFDAVFALREKPYVKVAA